MEKLAIRDHHGTSDPESALVWLRKGPGAMPG